MDYARNYIGGGAGLAQGSTAITTAYVGNAAEPDSASPIRDSVSSGEQILSEIHSTIDALEKRLDTMLTPVPPMPTTNTSQPIPQAVGSHLRGRMTILNEGYMHAVRRLHEVIRRVEL